MIKLHKRRKSESASHSVVSDALRPHGLQPARLLCAWDSPGTLFFCCCCYFCWRLLGSLCINFTNSAIGYVTSGRIVNPLCVYERERERERERQRQRDTSFRGWCRTGFCASGPGPQIVSECPHFKVAHRESAPWDDLIYGVDGKWKFQFFFYFRIFLLFWFPFKN